VYTSLLFLILDMGLTVVGLPDSLIFVKIEQWILPRLNTNTYYSFLAFSFLKYFSRFWITFTEEDEKNVVIPVQTSKHAFRIKLKLVFDWYILEVQAINIHFNVKERNYLAIIILTIKTMKLQINSKYLKNGKKKL
jgi:hypothetical protein